MRGSHFLRTLGVSVLDFLYPPLCLNCSVLLSVRHTYLCAACTGTLRSVRRDDLMLRGILSAVCSDGTIDDLVAPFWFDKKSPLQSVIHSLKYQNMPAVGEHYGRQLGRYIMKRGFRPTVIIPVPLHRAKFREREYNQAASIARGVGATLCAPVSEKVVSRIRYTRTQTELTAAERRRNVDGAFALLPAAPGRNADLRRVLLVDDVLTTGATTRSIAGMLRQNGCMELLVGTIAIAARSG